MALEVRNMKNENVVRAELLDQVRQCAQEMKRLGTLHDAAPQSKRDEIFDKMTDIRNRAMDMLQKAHGRRAKPLTIRFSSRAVSNHAQERRK
jgi:hypothetical protein